MFNFLRKYDDSDIKWAIRRHEKKIESLESDKYLIPRLTAKVEQLEKKLALMEKGGNYKLTSPEDRNIYAYFFGPNEAVRAARVSGGTLTYMDSKLGLEVTRHVTTTYKDPLEI